MAEILNQILYVQYQLKHTITNYVFMGMGEPLDNYDNLVKAIGIMNEKEAFEIGARRITISTSGIIPAIDRLKDLGLQVNLAISLHAADNEKRNRLMPINKKYPIEALIGSCGTFLDNTNREITLEYVLIKDINDSLQDADALSKIAKRLNAKINLIPYSPAGEKGFRQPHKKEIEVFVKRLEDNKAKVTVRESKGKDICAACGQLAVKFN
jgi:23S rRNA (adenine2503-C2)-methyltransferase